MTKRSDSSEPAYPASFCPSAVPRERARLILADFSFAVHSLQRLRSLPSSPHSAAISHPFGRETRPPPRPPPAAAVLPARTGVQQIAVGLEKCLAQAPGRNQEGLELLGKHVLLAHVEPGLGRELVLQGGGFGNPAKAALGEQAELVVVVADDPAVPGHPEVLQQHVAGEDVGRGKVLDGVAVVDHCLPRRGLVGVPQKQVERGHPPFGVEMADDDAVALEPDGCARLAQSDSRAGHPESSGGETPGARTPGRPPACPPGRARTRSGTCP